MEKLYRFVVVLIVAAIGWLLSLLMYHFLYKAGMISENFTAINLEKMTQIAVTTWLISVVISIGFIFLKQKWRIALISLPIILPSLLSAIYAVQV
jgi:hypothetical protein